MSIKSPGLGAGGLASLTNYVSGTFTVTLVGVDTVVTGTAKYILLGNMVTLFIPTLTGNSNSTSKSLSGIPAAIRPSIAQVGVAFFSDSAITSNIGRFVVATDGTASLASITPSTNALGAFTGSGAFTLTQNTIAYVLS